MDILQVLQLFLRESATAALALFAIWSLKRLYEQRLEERQGYAEKLETVNATLIKKLEEGTEAMAVSTEVIRRNTDVLESLQRWLDDK